VKEDKAALDIEILSDFEVDFLDDETMYTSAIAMEKDTQMLRHSLCSEALACTRYAVESSNLKYYLTANNMQIHALHPQ
jgi:hypothetical protein